METLHALALFALNAYQIPPLVVSSLEVSEVSLNPTRIVVRSEGGVILQDLRVNCGESIGNNNDSLFKLIVHTLQLPNHGRH